MPGGRALLVSSLCLMASAACTRVNEQPEVAPTPAPPPPAQVRRGARPVPPPPRYTPPPPTAQQQAPLADASPPRADTLNGDPKGPRREDMQQAINAAMPGFQSCFRATTGAVNVSLAFSATPGGRAEAVRVTGGGPVVDGCLTRAVGQMKLPEFTGEAVPIQFPLSVERTVTPAAAAPAAAAPANQPPPSVFVKP